MSATAASADAPAAGPPVGMLVGGGDLPLEIAASIVRGGRSVHIVAIAGEADQDWSGYPHTMVGWGGIGAMLAALKGAGCRDLVIVGRVRRPDLSSVRPDLGLLRHLPAVIGLIPAGGDDSLLRRVVRFFEGQGLKVVGPAEVAPDLVAAAGAIATLPLSEAVMSDAVIGFRAIGVLGPFDVGQAVVVAGGRVIAVEAAEGTDGLIARLGAAARGGLLVKAPKPGQELRVDMPAIGPHTVDMARAAELAGIVVAAGGVLVARRAELTARADGAGIAVAAMDAASATSGVERPRYDAAALVLAAGRQPAASSMPDAIHGAQAVAALGALAPRACAVVARRHVLAVGIEESAAALVERASRLRQWGDRARWRRRGVLVLADPAQLDWQAIEAALRLKLAGIVVVSSGRLPAVHVDTAGRLGLFLLAGAANPRG